MKSLMRRETFLPPADMSPAGVSKGFNLSRWAIDHGDAQEGKGTSRQ
jgi:hypothetical protein